MRCPNCNKKLSMSKHYDAAYEWFECPKCEGCFTYDEIIEGGIKEPTNGKVKSELQSVKKLVAKGKKRRTEIEEDEAAVAEYEKKILTPVVKETTKHHRDEVMTDLVLSPWADEIQTVYEELGSQIDEHNARDKALILWREIHIKGGASAREQEVPHAACKEHAS